MSVSVASFNVFPCMPKSLISHSWLLLLIGGNEHTVIRYLIAKICSPISTLKTKAITAIALSGGETLKYLKFHEIYGFEVYKRVWVVSLR